MKRCTTFVAAFLIIATLPLAALAQLYWDINGSNPGATDDGGGLAAGTWDAPAALTGDYNGNGVVDAADYVAWRKDPGSFGGDPAGYIAWRANFGATGGGGGGTANWSTDATGSSPTAPWTAGETAVFSAGANATGAFNVTLSGAQSAGGVNFEEGAVTLAGSGLDLTGTGTIDTAATVTGTINSAIGGTVGLNKTGAGTLVLGGTNTYTGDTSIAENGGTIKTAAANTLPAATVVTFPATANAGSRLELFDAGNTTFNQTIAGLSGGGQGTTSPSVVDVGFATLTLDIPSGQSHRYDGYLRTSFTDLNTYGRVVKDGPGELVLGGLNNNVTLGFGGQFIVNEGRLGFANNVAVGANNQITIPSRLTVKDGAVLFKANAAATSLSLTPRTLDIDGSFTFDLTGSTANAQILPAAPGSGVGGINLNADSTINVLPGIVGPITNTPLGFTPVFILAGPVTDGANSYGITKTGAGTLVFAAPNDYQGPTTIQEGVLRVGPLTANSTPHATIGDGNSPVFLSGGALEYNGAPSNDGMGRVLTVTNPITMTASSAITYRTGSGGSGHSATGVEFVFSSSNIVASGGTLTLLNDGTSNEPNVTTPTVNPVEFRPTFTGVFDFGQPVVISNHTNPLVPNRTTALTSANTTGEQKWSGDISGNGSFVRKGAGGTTILSGNNSYTGNTTVMAGTLSITNPFLADAADVLLTTGGILDLNFVGTDTIDQLFIDTFSQPTGTWGAVGSGAMNESPLITGTGRLTVTNPGAGSALVVGAVPEPSTLSLVVVGLAIAAGRRRRRTHDGR